MKVYELNCEIVVLINADNIDEAEERVKNRFNMEEAKFYQLVDYRLQGKK